MVVGLIIRLTPGQSIQESVSFNYQFFFNLLLPPIILASGYELHQVGLSREFLCRGVLMLRAPQGQLFPKYWVDPHLCVRRHLHFRNRTGAYTLSMDANPS
jgi:hypothetical protein